MKVYEPSGDDNDTAMYKPETCFRCGGQMGLFKLKDTWKMRIDGTLHMVPVFSIPCKRCLQCHTAVMDGTSDEIIGWCEGVNWLGRVWIDRDDTSGLMIVGMENSKDAVMFRLRWADHLAKTMRHAA